MYASMTSGCQAPKKGEDTKALWASSLNQGLSITRVNANGREEKNRPAWPGLPAEHSVEEKVVVNVRVIVIWSGYDRIDQYHGCEE